MPKHSTTLAEDVGARQLSAAWGETLARPTGVKMDGTQAVSARNVLV